MGMKGISLSEEDKVLLMSMPDSVVEIVEASLMLVMMHYRHRCVGISIDPWFFKLRKALEGAWGHELPCGD